MGTWAETLDALVRERGGALYGYAFVLTGDHQQAHQLLHRGLVRTFRGARSTMPVGAAHAYVKRAIQVQAFNAHGLRAKSASPGIAEDDAFVPNQGAASGTRTSLHDAILALPPRERTCAVMRHFDGLGVSQIARELDVEPDMVRAHLAHAMDGLAQQHADLGLAPEELGDGDQVSVVVEVKDTKR